MGGLLKSTLAKRLQGERPSPLRASVAAVVAGVAAAVLTYRVVRS
jgi:1,4-dihydroxy-2-naphthoate octaprenyltransferase